jgi:hypothetical protein
VSELAGLLMAAVRREKREGGKGGREGREARDLQSQLEGRRVVGGVARLLLAPVSREQGEEER